MNSHRIRAADRDRPRDQPRLHSWALAARVCCWLVCACAVHTPYSLFNELTPTIETRFDTASFLAQPLIKPSPNNAICRRLTRQSSSRLVAARASSISLSTTSFLDPICANDCSWGGDRRLRGAAPACPGDASYGPCDGQGLAQVAPVWKSNSGVPRRRRDVVSVGGSRRTSRTRARPSR